MSKLNVQTFIKLHVNQFQFPNNRPLRIRSWVLEQSNTLLTSLILSSKLIFLNISLYYLFNPWNWANQIQVCVNKNHDLQYVNFLSHMQNLISVPYWRGLQIPLATHLALTCLLLPSDCHYIYIGPCPWRVNWQNSWAQKRKIKIPSRLLVF